MENYLNSERSFIYFEFNKNYFSQLIDKLPTLSKINFEIIYFEYNFQEYSDLLDIFNAIQKFDNVILIVKNLPIDNIDIIRKLVKFKKRILLQLSIEDFFIRKEILKKNDILVILKISENNMSNITEILKNDVKNIILFFEENVFDISLFISSLRINQDILILNKVISPELAREHPCNIYLCSKEACHTNKNDFPREIHVNQNGDLYPFGMINDSFNLGNIYVDNMNEIFNKYKNGSVHELFLQLNRIVFMKYILHSLYEFIIWNNCLFDEFKRGEDFERSNVNSDT